MNNKYWSLVEALDIKDQSTLQEDTRAEIWKKAYVMAKKIAKKQIKTLEAKEAKKRLAKQRKEEIEERKKLRKAAVIKKKLEEKKRRAEARALRKKLRAIKH